MVIVVVKNCDLIAFFSVILREAKYQRFWPCEPKIENFFPEIYPIKVISCSSLLTPEFRTVLTFFWNVVVWEILLFFWLKPWKFRFWALSEISYVSIRVEDVSRVSKIGHLSGIWENTLKPVFKCVPYWITRWHFAHAIRLNESFPMIYILAKLPKGVHLPDSNIPRNLFNALYSWINAYRRQICNRASANACYVRCRRKRKFEWTPSWSKSDLIFSKMFGVRILKHAN